MHCTAYFPIISTQSGVVMYASQLLIGVFYHHSIVQYLPRSFRVHLDITTPSLFTSHLLQRQFEVALKCHCKAIRKKKLHFAKQLLALEHDTQFFYGETHNRKEVKYFMAPRLRIYLNMISKKESIQHWKLSEDDWGVVFLPTSRTERPHAEISLLHECAAGQGGKAEK